MTPADTPDLGAWRAADELTRRLGIPVSSDGIAELARRGLLPVAGDYKGFPLYDGQALAAFTDITAALAANRDGQLRTADQAAAHLGIRRADLDHLTRAGLLTAAKWGRGPFDRRNSASVPLYRTADLDQLAADERIGWETVRATPKGHQSPVAALPDAPGTRHRRRKTWQDGPDAARWHPGNEDDGPD
jgi:hypothetical protein